MKARYWPWIGVKADGVGEGSSGMKIAFFSDFAGRNGEVNVRYRVELSEAERAELKGLLSGGKQAVIGSSAVVNAGPEGIEWELPET